MDFHGQFPELVDACGAPIELDESRIDLREVLECVGRTEATETGEGGRSRTHRQKVENPAAEAVDNVGQFSDQRPQGSAGGDHSETLLIQRFENGCMVVFRGGDAVFGPLAEHAWEGAVDGIGCPGPRRMDADTHVGAIGPMLETLRINGVGLGLEIPHFGQGQGDGPLPVGRGLQG